MLKLKKISAFITVLAVVVSLSMPVWAEEPEKININTATVKQLVELKRIGPKYAAKIVEYRETNGPFASPEEIMKVKGIGKKTYEANKDVITVE